MAAKLGAWGEAMFKFKYYDGIKAAQERTKRNGVDMQTPFDLATLGKDSWRARVYHRLFDLGVKYGFMALRRLRPVLKVGPLIVVSRAADVQKILGDPEHFGVPFGPEMTELAGGTNFVLGLEDEAHADQRATIMKVVRHSDVTLLETVSRETTTALAANAKGRLDIIKDGFTRVGTEACFAYFGLSASDPDAFADWTLSISALLFADPTGKPVTRELALKGAEGVRRVIDRSLSRTRPNDDTLLGRLLALQATTPTLTNGEIRAILVGLVTGFIPTTTLAAGRIIDELLRRPIAFEQAQKAARDGDKARLKAMLMEAARLNPALSPGQWRFTRKAQTIVDSAGRTTQAEPGDIVLVSTASALVDGAVIDNPYGFDAARDKSAYALAFGLDPHECIGKEVAITVITEIAAVLFALPGFKPAEGSAGRLGWCGAFPRRLDFVFEPPSPAGFAMPTYAIPVLAKVDAAALQAKIEALGNPARPDVQASADSVGTLHFVSASLLDLGSKTESKPHIFIEANADGDEAQAADAVARAFGASLGPIVSEATGSSQPFADLLKRFTIMPTTLPVGATGLNFPGLPDFSTGDIEREAKLASFAREAVDAYLTMKIGRSARAFDVLDFVRRLIRPDGAARAQIAAEASGRLAELARRGAEFAPDILLPSRRRLTMMDWTQPSKWQFAKAILLDRTDLLTVKIPYLVFALAIAYRNFEPRFAKHGVSLSFTTGSDFLKAVIAGLLGALIPFIVIAAAAALWLWRLESRDVPDDREPSLEKIASAATVEDAPGFAQNHFTSVSDMKPGLFRRATLALALWAVKETVVRYFRPGFVIDLGTINFARWLRPAGADKLVFFSNFDGSWHSYLEDFITKAHAGQSAVWSNGSGFPKTQWLIEGGANDGDRFKRWVRRQQVVTQFWYARFPGLAADVKRANGVIRFGLARATDETEARDWLSQFGSYARPDGVVESAEVQSIVFRGYQHLPYATYALIKLPEDRARLGKWLTGLVGGTDGVASRDPGLEVAFGDKPLEPDAQDTPAAFVAFTAQGLVRAGFPSERPGQKSTSFPGAFNLGMATRGRILGDLGASASERWLWSDGDEQADALLIGYGASPKPRRR